jgi:hypothetical protein
MMPTREHRSRKGIYVIIILAITSAPFTLPAMGETLSWNAVTTYTDDTPIAPATVTYQAYWTTDSTLSTDLEEIGESTTSTSKNFDVDTEEMPRGTVIYFTCICIVGGVNSDLATPLSWTVPTSTSKGPSPPIHLRLN